MASSFVGDIEQALRKQFPLPPGFAWFDDESAILKAIPCTDSYRTAYRAYMLIRPTSPEAVAERGGMVTGVLAIGGITIACAGGELARAAAAANIKANVDRLIDMMLDFNARGATGEFHDPAFPAIAVALTPDFGDLPIPAIEARPLRKEAP
jgi:hypothetical protein